MKLSRAQLLRAQAEGNPVITGDQATFFWEGRHAPALISDANDWNVQARPFKRVRTASTGSLWSHTLTLPRDAYLEYAFYDPLTQERFLDPLNRRTVSNGLGGRNNYFYMPEGGPSPFAQRRTDVPAGQVTTHRVDTRWLRDDSDRDIFLYRPPVKQPVPLIVVYDGHDYLQRARLASVVDTLLAAARIPPVALAFLPNGGRWRSVEYSCSDATLLWLDQVVLPLAGEHLSLLNLKKQPGAFGVLGASLGGTMALYTALRMPDVFGRALIQSGAYMIESRDFAVVDLVRHGQAPDLQLWLDVGRLDILLEDNRRMQALLQERGYQVGYREFAAGHNYTAWRDNVAHGLQALFPGPAAGPLKK